MTFLQGEKNFAVTPVNVLWISNYSELFIPRTLGGLEGSRRSVDANVLMNNITILDVGVQFVIWFVVAELDCDLQSVLCQCVLY